MASEVEEIEAILREHLHPTQVVGAHHYWTDEPGFAALAAAIAALRAQDRAEGAGEMRESQPKAVILRQLSDDEKRVRAEALAQAYRDEGRGHE